MLLVQTELILLYVRWYLKHPLTYHNLVELMVERGLSVFRTTIMRWIIQYSQILDQRVRKHLKITNDGTVRNFPHFVPTW